jgi:glyceraldehyde-3-phosphate dehydrogenase (NAD(P))
VSTCLWIRGDINTNHLNASVRASTQPTTHKIPPDSAKSIYRNTHGHFKNAEISHTDDKFVINGKTIRCYSDRNPLNLPWKDWGVDLVIESTGVFNTDVGASKHLQVGAKKVILTAPGKGDGVGTYVVGVNADQYRHEDYDVLSNARQLVVQLALLKTS